MKLLIATILTLAALSTDAQYIFVFLNKKPDAEKLTEEKSKEIMAAHFANMERLAKEKKLLAAGPFDGGGGIFILNTTNSDTAKYWISPDTGIKANRWNVEMLIYSPAVGNVCAVSAPYTMVSYSFVRFAAASGDKIKSKMLKKHLNYVRTLKASEVVTIGNFANGEGGILVTKTELTKDILDKDPIVEKKVATYELKKLYIAKGSFCEE